MSEFITPLPAGILTTDHSVLVGTTAQWIFTAGQLQRGLRWMRIINVFNDANSPIGFIWLSRSGAAASPFAPGNFCLSPGEMEIFQGSFIPLNPLSAIATVANTPLTVEIG